MDELMEVSNSLGELKRADLMYALGEPMWQRSRWSTPYNYFNDLTDAEIEAALAPLAAPTS